MSQSFDIIIVGAGIVGAACAAECAAAGLKTLVLGRGIVGGGTTAAGMGHIVAMDDSEAQFALTEYSRRLWLQLRDQLSADVEYELCGTLWVAADDAEMAEARRKEKYYTERKARVEILDGLGSTEALHIFLSNRPDAVRYGSSGLPVPGYQLDLRDEHGDDSADGEIGDLWCKGPSIGDGYWNNREASSRAFVGGWLKTGDKYFRDADGYYHFAGRSDDMLKVGGIWVSPFEVETVLLEHPQVREAAVIGAADKQDLVKPKAFVVLRDARDASAAMAEELQEFVKARVAPYKYPRWIEFRDELPRTATGKLRRFELT